MSKAVAFKPQSGITQGSLKTIDVWFGCQTLGFNCVGGVLGIKILTAPQAIPNCSEVWEPLEGDVYILNYFQWWHKVYLLLFWKWLLVFVDKKMCLIILSQMKRPQLQETWQFYSIPRSGWFLLSIKTNQIIEWSLVVLTSTCNVLI